jgi:hypothetical protein
MRRSGSPSSAVQALLGRRMVARELVNDTSSATCVVVGCIHERDPAARVWNFGALRTRTQAVA